MTPFTAQLFGQNLLLFLSQPLTFVPGFGILGQYCAELESSEVFRFYKSMLKGIVPAKFAELCVSIASQWVSEHGVGFLALILLRFLRRSNRVLAIGAILALDLSL